MTIQIKATEQYFPVLLFIMLYKVILTFKSVDEILKCDHLNESYRAVALCFNCTLLFVISLFRRIELGALTLQASSRQK